MPRIVVNAGDRYGQLEILGEMEVRRSSAGVKRWFRCRCDCGKECEVRLGHLRSGHTESCGCLVVPPSAGSGCPESQPGYHGMEGSPEHGIWLGMKDRCRRVKASGYANYGGRGIKVCDRWRSSFRAFYEDMGPRPSPDHQIDRIDGDGDYEPGNCRWATRAEQNRNRKNNRFLTFRGHTLCLTDWAKRVGMSKGTLLARLQSGMTVQEALTTPVRRWRTDDEFRLTPVVDRDAEWRREAARRSVPQEG